MNLITGATGLLGSHVALDLCRAGRKVRAIRRAGSDLTLINRTFSCYSAEDKKLLEKIEWVDADLLDYFSLADALEGVDEVYHCAAIVSFHPSDRKQLMKINVEGTANLVNACLENNNIRMCHVSSTAALGKADKQRLITEANTWKSSSSNSVYSVSKYGAEREVWRGIAEGLQAVIVNPSIILGPGDWGKGSSELFSLVWKGLKYFSYGVNGYVDVRDVSAAMLLLVQQQQFGQRFVVSAENVPFRELFNQIAVGLGREAPRIGIRPWMAEIAWRIIALGGLITGTKPAITRETARSSNRMQYFSSEKLISSTDFRFRPVDQSIREICAVFLSEKEGNLPVYAQRH